MISEEGKGDIADWLWCGEIGAPEGRSGAINSTRSIEYIDRANRREAQRGPGGHSGPVQFLCSGYCPDAAAGMPVHLPPPLLLKCGLLFPACSDNAVSASSSPDESEEYSGTQPCRK